ncbi:MAG: hypothetical protein JNM07_02560 [Phycisphaerae bacterium]|nr:hypothetical protein [Phycisphaerae bacterium]
MTQSYTTTQTFTRTDARYIAGKVAADLRQLSQAYGEPTEQHITNLMAELTEYLVDGYLDRVTYGFRKGDRWIVALKYSGADIGSLTADDRSGRVPRGADVIGASWCSHLVLNSKWWALTDEQRSRYEKSLPIQRTNGTEPSPGARGWIEDKTYSSSGGGVRRASAEGVS